jgi:hypothetical protein
MYQKKLLFELYLILKLLLCNLSFSSYSTFNYYNMIASKQMLAKFLITEENSELIRQAHLNYIQHLKINLIIKLMFDCIYIYFLLKYLAPILVSQHAKKSFFVDVKKRKNKNSKIFFFSSIMV